LNCKSIIVAIENKKGDFPEPKGANEKPKFGLRLVFYFNFYCMVV